MQTQSRLDPLLLAYLMKKHNASEDHVKSLARIAENDLDRRMGFPAKRPAVFDTAVLLMLELAFSKSNRRTQDIRFGVHEMIRAYVRQK